MKIPENARYRGAVVLRKLAGRLPGVGFSKVFQVATTSGNTLLAAGRVLEHDKQLDVCLIQENGEPPLWFPVLSPDARDGDEIWLSRVDYYHHEYIGHVVEPGGVIFDCGGYAGTFTQWAFKHGAETAVIFEPDPRSVECIRRNLAKEIAAGRVILKVAGCWSASGQLEFSVASSANASTFNPKLAKPTNNGTVVPVVTLDEVATELDVKRVDLVKMDIEGAERQALQGAQRILSQFVPRLVICTYHLRDDRTVIPDLIQKSSPAYGTRRKHWSGRKVDVWY